MNKAELLDAMAKQFGLTKTKCNEIAHFVLDELVRGASNDGRAVIGKHIFKKTVRKARKGRNPTTGQELQIPEKTLVVYKKAI